MSGDVSLTFCGERLWLLPERAVYWPARRTLILADPHFGKAAAFRAGGIPIPGGTTAGMLRRLDAALERTGATRLVILGDLLHARSGRSPRTLTPVTEWRAGRPGLQIALVRGNHDRHAGDPPDEWRVECLDAPVADPPFVWLHEPPDDVARSLLTEQPDDVARSLLTEPQSRAAVPAPQTAPSAYPIAGHVHPAVVLNGGGRAISLPCFYFGRAYGLLPAFGEFTGTAIIRPRAGDRVYVLAGDEIVAKSVP